MGWDIPGANLMNYITFRGSACVILALVIAFWIGPKIIHRLQKKQVGETIRDLGLEGQLAKKGTPTMGGLIIYQLRTECGPGRRLQHTHNPGHRSPGGR